MKKKRIDPARRARERIKAQLRLLEFYRVLVELAREMADAGRVLPGLYVVDADGRPAFSSQAAADFVNVLNAFDAARNGTPLLINAAPNGSVSAHLPKGNTCRTTMPATEPK